MSDKRWQVDIEVNGKRYPLAVIGRPGVWSWEGLDPGTAALLAVCDPGGAERLLDLGCGTGVIGAALALAVPAAQVTLVDCNAAAVACAEATVRANRLTNAQVRLADGCAGLPEASFDRVLCHLPRERGVQEELLHGAATALRPGGVLYLVAHRQAGVDKAIALARELFGRCGVIRQKKGYHVAMAIRPPDLTVSLPEPVYTAHAVHLDGVETVVVGKPGVFAWERLDEGAAALVAGMRIAPGERVLELGCGSGLVGVAVTRRTPAERVTLLDVDLRAVESTRRTLQANGVANAEVLLSDCGAELPAGQWDVVVTNPPFHQDVETDATAARRFVAAAARLLTSAGRLYLVANRFLPYAPWIEAVFARTTVAWEDGRFRVWEACSPRKNWPRNDPARHGTWGR